ncbi:phosphatase PAP2 family protein [Chitinophaga sp. Cy-1792]|uniref:phosphatase PAP2 family protein n=1 Tax=Chitinophaga sp. Cy-1792 TaxID=2608339 RepID=UPI001F042DE2|nr:phosphatase PAP2 family protein [Chitinophaga sp. Cy-1792]
MKTLTLKSSMKKLAPTILIMVLLLAQLITNAQTDTTTAAHHKNPIFSPGKVSGCSYIVPAALIGIGTVATIVRVHDNEYKDVVLNTTKKEPGLFAQPENYTAFAPAAAVIVLNLAGVKGKHEPAEQALLYAASAGITAAIVYPLKSATHVLRPDNTDYQSFPSTHAAIAFASAEFLRREYGDQSVWYTIGGYAAATATAIIRVAKDDHWAADVIAGAGIGIASTTTAYWLYDKIKVHVKNKKRSHAFLMPAVAPNFYGAYLVKAF